MEVLSFCKKPYQTWQTALKTFKKYQNAPTRTHEKSYYYIDFYMNTHSSLRLPLPPLFLKGEMKFPKNWVGRLNFKKICMENQKGGGRGNTKIIGSYDFFHFPSLTVSYDGN